MNHNHLDPSARVPKSLYLSFHSTFCILVMLGGTLNFARHNNTKVMCLNIKIQLNLTHLLFETRKQMSAVHPAGDAD